MDKKSEVIEIDILRLIRAVLKRIWIVILAAFICGAAAFSFARFYVSPTYTASVLMYVNNSSFSIGSTSFGISPSELSAAQNLVDTYIVILKTRNTLNAVIQKADLDYSYEQLSEMISASSVEDTEIFRINVTSTDPKEAKLIANTVAETLPERISNIVNGSSVKIVDHAVTPVHRASPSYNRYTAIGIAIGVILSGGVIVVLEMMDDLVHSADMLPGDGKIPLLAEIPNLSSGGDGYGYKRYGSYKYSKGYGYGSRKYSKGYGYGYGHHKHSKGYGYGYEGYEHSKVDGVKQDEAK